MSRSQAKRSLKVEDFEREMKEAGVFSTSVGLSTLDEAPGTYKPAAIIQEAIVPTATIIARVRPVYNLKSAEEIYGTGKCRDFGYCKLVGEKK